MIRGTTPTLRFNLPFNTNRISSGYVTFSQQRSIVVDKAISTCTLDGNTIIVNLTQEDTLKFKNNYDIEMQIRVKLLENNKVLASNIMTTSVDRILHNGVI